MALIAAGVEQERNRWQIWCGEEGGWSEGTNPPSEPKFLHFHTVFITGKESFILRVNIYRT